MEKLTPLQMRAFFYRTSEILTRGLGEWFSDEKCMCYAPFLGDFIQLTEDEIAWYKGIGSKSIEEIRRQMKEILELELGYVPSEETEEAFRQAKVNVENGATPDQAWPIWYSKYGSYPPKDIHMTSEGWFPITR